MFWVEAVVLSLSNYTFKITICELVKFGTNFVEKKIKKLIICQ